MTTTKIVPMWEVERLLEADDILWYEHGLVIWWYTIERLFWSVEQAWGSQFETGSFYRRKCYVRLYYLESIEIQLGSIYLARHPHLFHHGFDVQLIRGLMLQEEQIDPVPDMLQSAFHTVTATWKEIVECFCPVLELLYRSLHDLPHPAPSLVHMVLPSEGLAG